MMPVSEPEQRPRRAIWRRAAVPLLVATVIVSFFLAPSWSPLSSLTIDNPGQPQTLTLKPQTDQNADKIYYLSVRITGEIDGTVIFQREANKIPQDQLILTTGKIDEIWGSDWYEPECQLQLNPTKGTTGHLKIDYKFSDL